MKLTPLSSRPPELLAMSYTASFESEAMIALIEGGHMILPQEGQTCALSIADHAVMMLLNFNSEDLALLRMGVWNTTAIDTQLCSASCMLLFCCQFQA